MADRVRIFDTTLRDGEQAAGVSFSAEEKLQIAKLLERMGVDCIEAGFAAASPADFDAVNRIAREVRGTQIATLCRAVPNDVDQGWEAIRDAENPRIHVFLSSSDIHIAHQLRKDRESVLQQAREMVARAKQYTSDVEFSPMDATRSDVDFVRRMLREVIEAGATTINIPDTVGYAIPDEFARFITGILEDVPGADNVVVSVHCHNDLGLSTANSLAAVGAGARQVECTINGLGERAGNTSLEETVMAIRTRADHLDVEIGVDPQYLVPASRMVQDFAGMHVQPNKAIVGLNAFRHQSGIHQDGVVKMRETYEIMDPKEVGWVEGSQFVLSKLSGRAGFRSRLEDLGYELDADELKAAFERFQQLADRKTVVDDRDLEAIVMDRLGQPTEGWQLVSIDISAGTTATPSATVTLRSPDDEECSGAKTGTGPVDAIYQTIRELTGVEDELEEYSVTSITEGLDAQGDVTIRILIDGATHTGRAADQDILVASARAYINAINRHVSGQTGATAAATQERTP
ncbi:MAG: 2-isopropylmalate synthase [Chloroflexi bacterium]|nr:2-isopropylmalate synthase [Chloroflexota bacterium]